MPEELQGPAPQDIEMLLLPTDARDALLVLLQKAVHPQATWEQVTLLRQVLQNLRPVG